MYALTAWCITGMFTIPSNTSEGSVTRLPAFPFSLYDAASIVIVSAINQPCFFTRTIPPIGPAIADSNLADSNRGQASR